MSITRNEQLMRVILAPLVSEKTARIEEENHQVTFKVLKSASKKEIKDAVELLFDVEVERVQVLNQKGKKKMFGRFSGKRQDWKKAYVTLAEGSETIDFLGEM